MINEYIIVYFILILAAVISIIKRRFTFVKKNDIIICILMIGYVIFITQDTSAYINLIKILIFPFIIIFFLNNIRALKFTCLLLFFLSIIKISLMGYGKIYQFSLFFLFSYYLLCNKENRKILNSMLALILLQGLYLSHRTTIIVFLLYFFLLYIRKSKFVFNVLFSFLPYVFTLILIIVGYGIIELTIPQAFITSSNVGRSVISYGILEYSIQNFDSTLGSTKAVGYIENLWPENTVRYYFDTHIDAHNYLLNLIMNFGILFLFFYAYFYKKLIKQIIHFVAGDIYVLFIFCYFISILSFETFSTRSLVVLTVILSVILVTKKMRDDRFDHKSYI